MPGHDPLANYRYRLEIDGLVASAFSAVTIGETTTDTIDYRDGDNPLHVRKLKGLTKYGNVSLKRGITTSLEIFNWFSQVTAGGAAVRRNVVIVVMDETGTDFARFIVRGAWPIKYAVSELSGMGNEALIETLELVNQGIEREA